MMVIRPLKASDQEAFIDMAFRAQIGLTSLPKNRDLLIKRLEQSIESFKKEIKKAENERYLFALEDMKTGWLGGICGILARELSTVPHHYYRIEKYMQKPAHPSVSAEEIGMLRPIEYYEAPSELGSLYLLPEFRHSGNGRLLSLSRFLFIAAFPHRFDRFLFANMRGYINQENVSFFWEGVGRHFFDLDFEEVMHLQDEGSIDISAALPSNPIYINLLPKNVQEAIGKIHPETRPAITMLMQEGFQLIDEVDVFDGGPIIEVETKEVRSVKNSLTDQVVEITTTPFQSKQFIVANNKMEFRACFSGLIQKEQGVLIPYETAEALHLKIGDPIRYVKPYG